MHLPHLPPSRPALVMLAAGHCLQDLVQQEVCLTRAPFVPSKILYFLGPAAASYACSLRHVVHVCIVCISWRQCTGVWVVLAMQGSWQGQEELLIPAMCLCVRAYYYPGALYRLLKVRPGQVVQAAVLWRLYTPKTHVCCARG